MHAPRPTECEDEVIAYEPGRRVGHRSVSDSTLIRNRLPHGRRMPGDDPRVAEALSDHVGCPVQLLPEGGISHFDEGPVRLVTTGSLAALPKHYGGPITSARPRSKPFVDVGIAAGFVRNGWSGQTLAIGTDLVISVREPMLRCVT